MPRGVATTKTVANRYMKINQWLVAASIAVVMSLGVFQVTAQPSDNGQKGGQPNGGGGPGGTRGDRGNFDPAQMQQRMMERYKEVLEVTNDDEWKAIEPLVQKVMDARRDTYERHGPRHVRARVRAAATMRQAPTRASSVAAVSFGTPSPEADALQKAIDSKASKAEMKAALEKYAASRKAKQAELEKAQADLRKVLTPRQEAIATLNGLL